MLDEILKKDKLDVCVYGHPVLSKRSEKIEISDEIFRLSDLMKETMLKFDGIGLAAPQIGFNKRFVVIELPEKMINKEAMSPGEKLLLHKSPLILLNPELIDFFGEKTCSEEGCLSVPNIFAEVTRPEGIKLKAQFLSGEKFTVECTGFLSRIIQHECDHLEGMLFVDRLKGKKKKKVNKELLKMKQAYLPNKFMRRVKV